MRKFLTIIITLLLLGNTFVKSAVLVDTAIIASNGKHKLLISFPNDYDINKQYSLVVAIQPCNGTTFNSYVEALKPLTDSLKMIVVCPDNSKSGGWIADANMDIITVSIDSAMAMYNIDSKSVYLTGMSCNGEVTLRQGLKKLYPFKGIFPWDPYLTGVNGKIMDLNSKIPVTIAVGTSDDYLAATLNFYDSLKSHGANVNLVLVQGMGHTFSFANFGNEMIHSLYYLNDTNNIKIEPAINTVEFYEMLDTDGEKEVEFKVSHLDNKEMTISSLSSYNYIINAPEVKYTPADGIVKLKFKPVAGKKGNVFLVLEVKEKDGTAIEQVTIKVKVSKAPTAVNNSDINSKIEVYPNPASGQLYIKCEEQNLAVQIIDLNGRIVLKTNSSSNSSIDISKLSTGMYFLNAVGKNNYNTVKLSVK